MSEKPTQAELDRIELEQLRAEKEARSRDEAGLATGKLVCGTPGCPFDEKEAELQKHVAQRINEDTGMVENETIIWTPVDEAGAMCESCEYPLTIIPPGAQSVFPRNYRWVYPKPVK